MTAIPTRLQDRTSALYDVILNGLRETGFYTDALYYVAEYVTKEEYIFIDRFFSWLMDNNLSLGRGTIQDMVLKFVDSDDKKADHEKADHEKGDYSLTDAQEKQQSFFDSVVIDALNQLSPVDVSGMDGLYGEVLGNLKDAFVEALCNKLKVMTEMELYPYLPE